jgi:SAM-dependent methyltransferase
VKTEPVKSVIPSENFQYYGNTIYWNSFEPTVEHWNVTITGSPTKTWSEHIRDKFGPFDRALFVNCGNGWVERDLFKSGTIRSAVGFDISDALLRQATEEASLIGMPSRYIVADCNVFDPTELGEFDLIVNYAAMHHVAYLNRITQKIAGMLNKNGIYVALDYVGPHRNQYEWSAWSKVLETNSSLPVHLRNDLVYPHLATMLVHDPTEAIHSELIIEVVQRHFDLELLAPFGGAIAYPVLFNNIALHKVRHTEEGRALVSRILQVDREFTAECPDSSLFSFWVGRPKGGRDGSQLRAWQDEEDKRERGAAGSDGRYYSPTALELIYNMIAELRARAAQFKSSG